MALANIRKEEVDPLLAQIKNIMGQQEQNLGTECIDENFLDEENNLVFDQSADLSTDKLNTKPHNSQAAAGWEDLKDSKSTLNSSIKPNSGMDTQSITVDTLMRDLLTPLLKNWLEVNLSPLVKEIVETKIEKLMAEYQLTLEKDSE